MKNKFSRSVRFRDANNVAWTIECEIRAIDCERTNRVTLEKFHESQEVSFSGNGGRCGGQVRDEINPRTETQKKLLGMWRKYHLCGMSGGTDKQEAYLEMNYKPQYDKFVGIFSAYDKKFHLEFGETAWGILKNAFTFHVTYEPWILYIINEKMKGNPLKYIFGDGQKHFFSDTHDHRDYSVQCFFLALNGLYRDRGYDYGRSWLHDPVPGNMEEIVNELFDMLEKEEAELTESLDPTFDMGADDFKATPSIIEQVMELRDCTETEAKRFIALGMSLGCTFGDLNDTFEEVNEDNCLYRANGTDYYLGTDEELYDIAWNYMHDSDYDMFWREAVQAEKTEMGLEEWLKYVIDMDGWCSILNSWDGKYDDYKVGDDWICVSLA